MSENTNNPLDQFLEMEDDFDPFTDAESSESPESVKEETSNAPEQAPATEPVKEEIPKPETGPVETPVQTALVDDAPDPFAAALATAKAQSEARMTETLAEKDAWFVYGKAKEPVTDRDATFEDMQQKYEDDFPELSESKKVEWTVTYGKETKTVTNPGSDKVYEIKAEIEKSKKFLDALKKAKTDDDKKTECTVKPRIKAQSKGKIMRLPSYKDFCESKEEARKSEKAIVLLPSSDGRLYQIRKTAVGDFIAPVEKLPEFQTIVPGFQMNLPKSPMHMLLYLWEFFASLSDKYELEALAHILYDTRRQKYTVRIPKQELTKVSVESVMEEEYPEYLIHVMDIHSHNTMPAKFSAIDDGDEKATRLYAVMGRLDRVLPEITVRASCGGEFIPLDPAEVFETKLLSFPHPNIWDRQIALPKKESVPALPEPRPWRFWNRGKYVGEKV